MKTTGGILSPLAGERAPAWTPKEDAIPVILHIGMHEGAPCIVSELLEGETLRERMAGEALLERKSIDYALQIARGLGAAHERNRSSRHQARQRLY